MSTIKPPLSAQNVTRLLVIIIVVLALAAGYYHSAAQSWRNNFYKLKGAQQQPQLKNN
ncbi:MAG TPA: hypothetical protein VD999_04645 [Vitreimonas sp.]|nr:hypothetical protein [Vitreimonas sp.]